MERRSRKRDRATTGLGQCRSAITSFLSGWLPRTIGRIRTEFMRRPPTLRRMGIVG